MGSAGRRSGNSSNTASNNNVCYSSTAASDGNPCGTRRSGAGRSSHHPVEIHRLMYRKDNALSVLRRWPPESSSPGAVTAWHVHESRSSCRSTRRCRSEEAKQTQPCFSVTRKLGCTGEWLWSRKTNSPTRMLSNNVHSIPGLALASAAAAAAASTDHATTHASQTAVAACHLSADFPAAAAVFPAAASQTAADAAAPAAHGKPATGAHVCKKQQRLHSQPLVFSCAAGQHTGGAAAAAAASATSGRSAGADVACGGGAAQRGQDLKDNSGSSNIGGESTEDTDNAALPLGLTSKSTCLSFLPHTTSAVCSSSKEKRNVCSLKAGTGDGTPAGTAAAAAAHACDDFSVAGASDSLITADAVVPSSINGAAAASVNHGRRAAAAAVADSEGSSPTPASVSAWFLSPTCTAAVGPVAVCCTSQQHQGAAAPTHRGGEKGDVGGFVVACSLSVGEEQEEIHRRAGEASAGKRAAGGEGAAVPTERRDKERDGGGEGQASAARAHATDEVYPRGGGAAWQRVAADEIAAASPVAAGEATRPPSAGRSRLRRQPTGRAKRHIAAAHEEGEGGGGPAASTKKAHEMEKLWGIGPLMWPAKYAARTALPPQSSLQQKAFLQQPQKQRQRQQRRLDWEPGEEEEFEELDKEEKEEDEMKEGEQVGEAYGSETSGRLRQGRKKTQAETYWSLLQELLIRVRRSSSYGVQLLLLLGEDFREKLLQQKVRLESGKRLSGRCFFYLLLTFFLMLLALVLLLGTLQHEHKLYRLRPRQVLLLQQHTQRQLQQRMQQQQEQQQRQGDSTDGARQQRFFETLLHHPVPSLRPCPHESGAGAATAKEKWRPYSAAAAASACVSGEEDVCSRGTPESDKSSVSSQQSCPKTEEDTALLAPAAAATADVPEDKRRRLPLSTAMHSSLSLTKTRGHAAGTTSFTSSNASIWRGTDMLGVCCVPLAVSPYSSAAYCKEGHGVQSAASAAEAANTSMDFTGTHVMDDGFSASRVCGPPPAAADVSKEAYTNTFVSAGDRSTVAATAAAHMAFPRNVFFFSLHGHPPPLSFLDPASPVLVCAEADERQLLLRLLLQLIRPFCAASDAMHGLLQRLRFHVDLLSTTQQQNHQVQQQLVHQEHNKKQEQSPEHQQSNQREMLQRRGVVSAAVQEDAAALPCSGTSCCGVAPAGGVCNNILEEAAAAVERAASAAAAEDGLAASDRTELSSPWETRIVHVLANGSSACCCSCPAAAGASSRWLCGQVPEKLAAPVLSQEAKLGPAAGARPPPPATGAVPSFLQKKADETTAPAGLLSRLCEGEEPRLQVYAHTLRASFNGLLSRYIQMRFAALSTAAAFPSTLYGNAARRASPAAVDSTSAAASSRLAMTQRGRDAFFSAFWPVSVADPTPVTVGMPCSLDSRILFSPTAAAHSSGIPHSAPRSSSPYAGGAADAAAAASSSLLSGASVSAVLLTRLASLLPADTSIYFSFSSYLSPCYPFSRFLHRRLVGWGGLQLHILLFGGWFHSLFATEPLTLVHAPRALFLFVLAAYRGLILYEAFSSLEAHYFRRAHTLQQQEHLRAAATAAAAAAEEDAAGKHSGGSAGRRRGGEKRQTEFGEDILFERDDMRLFEQQGVRPASMKAGYDSSCFGSSGSSSGYPVRGRTTVSGEAEKKEQVEEGEKQQQHRSEETGENETGRRRKSCGRTYRHTEEEGETVAAAAWTDFSDHVVLYVLVAIFAAMEIAAARSSHTRLRVTPAASGSSNPRNPAVCCTCSSSSSSSTKPCSSGRCCSSGASSCSSSSSSINSSSSDHRSSNSRCGGNKLARGRGDAVPPAVGETSSIDSRYPSSTLMTPAGNQYHQEMLQRVAPRANSLSSAAAVHQPQSTIAGDVATAAKPGAPVVAAGGSAAVTAAPAPVAYLSQSCANNTCGTEAPGRQSGTGKLYIVVWMYYGFLLLCCFHMAFYTACFFHTPKEIWSGLGVGLVFLVLPLVIACEVLEKPTLQRLGIGSGERRAAKQATSAAEAVACGGGAVGGASSSREPTGSSKRFTDAEEEEIALKEDVEDEEEEEMGFGEDRLSSSSSLSVHSRSSSSSSNCSRLRERAVALAEAGLIPAYRRRSHFCSSSGSNSSHGGTSPLPAAPQRQLQEIAFPYLSRVTRTRSSHSRRREDSSSGHLHRSRNRSSGYMTTATAATLPGRVTRKYCYSGVGGPPLLQQHEDAVAIR